MAYAELHCISNFSFLRGASRPEELVARAATLGYHAIALTDECSLAGLVKAHVAARRHRIRLIAGSEFHTDDGLQLVLLAPDRRAYGELASLITRARRRCPKGRYRLDRRDLRRGLERVLAIWSAADECDEQAGYFLRDCFRDRLWIGVSRLLAAGELGRCERLYRLAATLDLPAVACGDVHMHDAGRKQLQDILTAIRLNRPVQTLGTRLCANAERHLRPLERLAELYPPALLAESCRIADRCTFSLDQLRYDYPEELVPPGTDATTHLRQLVTRGAGRRWPAGVPPSVSEQIERELALIAELHYEHYFLTVFDIVHFAKSHAILCQGRGSAANSVVCYCLFITEVSPEHSQLLFERFISKERDEPPDIDVDFEHERREEVVQYIYRKYTREHAALAATVITYRPRSAIRDVGKALGLDPLLIDQLGQSLAWWDHRDELRQRFAAAGLGNTTLAEQFTAAIDDILGFPRHLSQHVGGFVITRSPISTLVPVENAAMLERTVIQWDKQDIETLGLLKVDILALGMLTAIRKCFELIHCHYRTPIGLDTIPPGDLKTYDMLCRADTIGVFQVESRAQMAMLPRLAPRCWYDLVIEVAIVRPGPIQGDMVHPYLRRRQGREAVEYPSEAVRAVLQRTLGVPIFQEQAIKLAMVAAGFSGGAADRLRRAMASWGKSGDLLGFRDQLLTGMRERGYSEAFAERLFRQIQGFGGYGFPESHAASFALLVYASAWLKCHYPAAFYCAVLNSQPMGFYSASQLVQDARRHGIDVHAVSVDASGWDHSLVSAASGPALQLGLRLVRGIGRTGATRLVNARREAPFSNLRDLARRTGLARDELDALVAAGATARIAGHRRQGHWQRQAIEAERPLLDPPAHAGDSALDDGIELAPPGEVADMLADYRSTGLTLARHPMAILRADPLFRRCRRATDLATLGNGRFVRIAGLVTGRQRPASASGVVFLTLEDETGNSSVIVWRAVQDRSRQALLHGRLLLIKGVVEAAGGVVHVIAGELLDCSQQLGGLISRSRDFR